MKEIKSLIYFSEETKSFDKQMLNKMGELANNKNKDFNITGFLSYSSLNLGFFQYIEGPKKNLNHLLRNLKNDSRHSIIRVLYFDTINYRLFPDWEMRCFFENELYESSLEANIERVIRNIHQLDWKEEPAKKLILHNLTQLSFRK